MISTKGLTPIAALALIDRQADRFAEAARSEPLAKREIAAFRERIAGIRTVGDLVKDHTVYSFVMKAFGLEREMPAKAMMKRILTADPADTKSLVNRLTDPRYREINKVLNFHPDGTASQDFGRAAWADGMVERYVAQRVIDGQTADNPTVGIALDFERKAKGLTSWFKVLADPKMASFVRTAFGLPDAVAQGDVDAQARMLEQRMKIADLQDPNVRKKLVRQYAALAGVQDQTASRFTTAALIARPQDASTWQPVAVDVAALGTQAYRLWR